MKNIKNIQIKRKFATPNTKFKDTKTEGYYNSPILHPGVFPCLPIHPLKQSQIKGPLLASFLPPIEHLQKKERMKTNLPTHARSK